jgi:hypothetical protein
MSHRFDCPSKYEARRTGERAFERGDGSWRNPYKSDWPDEGCPEAAQEWRRGYRDAERRQEEREEEERIERHLQEVRAQEEARYNAAMEDEYYRLYRQTR